ncbi:hypothetical protein [Runella sp.]|uniref:hypothetical protein n=1 Tax=Runella sp. TaxID=1960881 RepID=UPI003017834D
MATKDDIERKYKIMKLKLNAGDDEVSNWFGYKTAAAFRASSARNRIVEGMVTLYEKIKGPESL